MVHRRFVPPFRAVLQPRTHRIDNAGKFEEQTVARGFDDATTVFLDLGISQFASYRLKRRERSLLVLTHQARIARDIGGKDRGEAAGLAHVVSPAAKRTPERNSSRCSGFRQCIAVGTTTDVTALSRSMASLASSIRPICA